MQRPPLLARSFPLLTLALAIPLVAILAYITYDRYLKDDGDGWQTYRSERFKFEIRLPPTWEVERDSGGDISPGLPTQYTGFVDGNALDVSVNTFSAGMEPALRAPRAVVWINPQGDWCTSTVRIERESVTVSGVTAEESRCFEMRAPGERCDGPCDGLSLGILRIIQRVDLKFWVFADSNGRSDAENAARYATIRKIIDSFRFVD